MMVQPRNKTSPDWSDTPTVPIKPPDRYAGDAPTWPVAPPPPTDDRQGWRQQAYTRQRYVPAQAPQQPWFLRRAPALICLVFTVIEIMIGMRVLLKLFAANPSAEFSGLVYMFTDIFVAPFQGTFPSPSGHGSVLEISSAVAIPIYALLARFCMSIARMVRGWNGATRAHP